MCIRDRFFFSENQDKYSFVWYKNLDRSFYRFVTIHACDRRTEFSSLDRVCIPCNPVKSKVTQTSGVDHSGCGGWRLLWVTPSRGWHHNESLFLEDAFQQNADIVLEVNQEVYPGPNFSCLESEKNVPTIIWNSVLGQLCPVSAF